MLTCDNGIKIQAALLIKLSDKVVWDGFLSGRQVLSIYDEIKEGVE